MEFLINLGGRLLDCTIVAVGHQVGYLIYYNRNVKSLEDQLNDLVDASKSVDYRVTEEKYNIREADDPVKKWMTEVKKITEEANEILTEQHKEKMKRLCGLFPDIVARHQLSRKSTKLVSSVAELYGKKDFTTYAHDVAPQDVPSKDYEAFSSRTTLVDQIMDELENNLNISLIGIYGFGGVGKTTLVKEVARQASGDKTLFDDVVLILDVKQDPSIQRIQKEIAEKLRLKFHENESSIARARRIYTRIKDQKTLVILDNVWEKIDLEAVGLSGVRTCKVLLTSRTGDFLKSEMQTEKDFSLDLLKVDESWDLFKKKAGDVVNDPAIKPVATQVAKKCGGLPVLVVNVASALKSKDKLHAWKDALRRLKRLDKAAFEEKINLTLEWSYNQLSTEELKQLFLLCGLLASASKEIYIPYIFKCAIGLGYYENLTTPGEAWNYLNTLLEKLKDSCLLLDNEVHGWLKMHDLVHDVAKLISSRDYHVLHVSDGDEFREWPRRHNKDFCEKCTMIFVSTSNIPQLPQILPSKELTIFVLESHIEYYSLDIPHEFFKETPKLRVLDLTSLKLQSLPSSIELLKELKTLCLDGCKLGDITRIGQLKQLEVLSFSGSMFQKLPKEVGELTHLRILDLTDCSELKIIASGVISDLKRLEELRMRNSFNQWKADEEPTIIDNASLSELKCLSKMSCLDIHILDAKILPRDLFSDALERFRIYIGAEWNWNDVDENYNTLKIKLITTDELYDSGLNKLLKITDELHLDGTVAGMDSAHQLDGEEFQRLKHLYVHKAEFQHIVNGKGVFCNLEKLTVSGLDSARFLLSSSTARSLVQLTHLDISKCPMMEEILSTNASDRKHMKGIFSKLQELKLQDLPILTKFCSRYPSLEIVQPKEYKEIERMDTGEDIQNALFDEKVLFPTLKNLYIIGLTKIMTVWHHQNSPESFKNIERVYVAHCRSLKSVFPVTMLTNLQKLMRLNVDNCGVEQIIQVGIPHKREFVLPKVSSISLTDLPNLKCFYNNMHCSQWPSLEELEVSNCSKVTFLAQECSTLQRNNSRYSGSNTSALFSINKDSFSNLKGLTLSGMEIWDGPFPVSYFGKLESLAIENSNTLLEKFTGFPIYYGATSTLPPPCEISSEQSETEDNYSMGALTQLSHLWLTSMSCLEHLGNDNSHGAEEGHNFPNLKVLGIGSCDSLRNLRSSVISFKNLTHLQVADCWTLEYMITFSTAKCLNQLIVLSAENCARLLHIVDITDEDDNVGNGIVFKRLQYLELANLPGLQSFSSKDCNVKFPSLNAFLISKRLKSKIFRSDETLKKIYERVGTDIDSDNDEAYIDAVDGETSVEVDEGETYIDAGDGETSFDAGDGEKVNKNGVNIDVAADAEQNDQEVTAHVFPVNEPSLVAQVIHTDDILIAEDAFSNIDSVAHEARPTDAPAKQLQHISKQSHDPSEPLTSAATSNSTPIIRVPKPSGEKWSLIVLLFVTLFVGICITFVSLPHLRPGSRICTSVPELCLVISPFLHHQTSHQENVQRFITPVDEGEVRTPLLPGTEHPPRSDALVEHNVEKQMDPFVETSASATVTPTLTNIHALMSSSSSPILYEPKRSTLRKKLQDRLSSRKAVASISSLSEETKTKFEALIATADLKDLRTRQKILAVLATLQLSTTKWIADLVVEGLAKMQLVMDKEELLCQELAAHVAKRFELDMRSQKLLSEEGSIAEKNIEKIQENMVELPALIEQIKKLEAQVTSLQDQIADLENRHKSFEASLEQLDEEEQLNQFYLESTNQELLRNRAECASLSIAIFTYLRQLLK